MTNKESMVLCFFRLGFWGAEFGGNSKNDLLRGYVD